MIVLSMTISDILVPLLLEISASFYPFIDFERSTNIQNLAIFFGFFAS